MNAERLIVPSFVLLGIASLVSACDTKAETTQAGTTPAPQSVWVAVDDEWIYPLRLDSVEALDAANYHYQRTEERSAAREIRRAVSWLDYAARHAQPITRTKLETAQTRLRTLADDLSMGRTVSAGRMSSELARASEGLAEWHFYRAREQYGKNDARYASQDLQAAAMHLQRAADSAHFQFGPDTVVVFDDIIKDGRVIEEGRTVDHNVLGKRLDAIEKAVKDVAKALA